MFVKSPKDIFSRIDKALTLAPAALSMDHYHTAKDGTEAITMADVLHSKAHCLIGWVLRLTPGGLEAADGHPDPMEIANDALEAVGKAPLPWGIVMGTKEDALRLIRGRSAEERALGESKGYD